MYFYKSLQELKIILGSSDNSEIKKVVLPIGIGTGLVNQRWLYTYYQVIKKFAADISTLGKECFIAVKKPYLYSTEKYVSKVCDDESRVQFNELKNLPWNDIDEK